ncbi:MAG TPA: hypothetical protein VHJ78_03045 [Actinomycetota bacterium]|nr:hypothetical protein [Actinomycetota bacterium]
MAAVLGFLLVGSVVAAVLNARRLEGSVPGKAPILGLAATPEGFLIGTANGVLSSADGREWRRVAGFEGESLVAGSGGTVAVLSGGRVAVASNLQDFTPVPGEVEQATALTVTPAGRIWVAGGADLLLAGDRSGLGAADVTRDDGPEEVLSLGVRGEAGTTVLAGGLSSGLWRFDGGWQRILGTPIRAVLIDPASDDRYFLGTSAGVLVAGRTAPEFTDLRLPVEALAESEGTYYAITADRLLYQSRDGLQWEARTAGE